MMRSGKRRRCGTNDGVVEVIKTSSISIDNKDNLSDISFGGDSILNFEFRAPSLSRIQQTDDKSSTISKKRKKKKYVESTRATDQQVDRDNESISFLLTPASSTTSLNELAFTTNTIKHNNNKINSTKFSSYASLISPASPAKSSLNETITNTKKRVNQDRGNSSNEDSPTTKSVTSSKRIRMSSSSSCTENTVDSIKESQQALGVAVNTTVRAVITKSTRITRRASAFTRKPAYASNNNPTATTTNTTQLADIYLEKENSTSSVKSTAIHQQPSLSAAKSSSNLQRSKVLNDSLNTSAAGEQSAMMATTMMMMSRCKSSTDLSTPTPLSPGMILMHKLYPRHRFHNRIHHRQSSDDQDEDREEGDGEEVACSPRKQQQRSARATPLPQVTWAHSGDLWQAMRAKESLVYRHDALYLQRARQRGAGVEPHMRAILLDWLVEISHAYRLHRETWHLCVEFIDRFMSQSAQAVRLDRLQLLGVCALYTAAKCEEIYPPRLREFAAHMDDGAGELNSSSSEECMRRFELHMLKTLGWQVAPCTANTWLQVYLQIACVNYEHLCDAIAVTRRAASSGHELEPSQSASSSCAQIHTTRILLPLHLYKNSNSDQQPPATASSSFYVENFLKAVTLLDVCMFDMESLQFSYSALAAAALYHMLLFVSDGEASVENADEVEYTRARLVSRLVELCTGYALFELDACIKWMQPHADACRCSLGLELIRKVKQFSNVDPNDAHNIQLYYQYLDILKESQSRKTKSAADKKRFYSNPLLLTPPESNRKYSMAASHNSSSNQSNPSSSCSSPNYNEDEYEDPYDEASASLFSSNSKLAPVRHVT